MEETINKLDEKGLRTGPWVEIDFFGNKIFSNYRSGVKQGRQIRRRHGKTTKVQTLKEGLVHGLQIIDSASEIMVRQYRENKLNGLHLGFITNDLSVVLWAGFCRKDKIVGLWYDKNA